MDRYTFLYVPYIPLDILVNCYAFLFVLYTFRIRSPHKIKDFAGKLYVLIRSVQPSRYSHDLQEIRTRSVYVPIHSVYLLHEICEMGYGPTASEGLVQLHLDSHTPVLMWPSRFRSYTFRYTFLYVPVRCSRTKGLSSCAWFPTRVLMRPSCLRSYTFRYTFLYVPVRCRRTRLYVEGCPHTPLSLHP